MKLHSTDLAARATLLSVCDDLHSKTRTKRFDNFVPVRSKLYSRHLISKQHVLKPAGTPATRVC